MVLEPITWSRAACVYDAAAGAAGQLPQTTSVPYVAACVTRHGDEMVQPFLPRQVVDTNGERSAQLAMVFDNVVIKVQPVAFTVKESRSVSKLGP